MTTALLTVRDVFAGRRCDPRFGIGLLVAALGAWHLTELAIAAGGNAFVATLGTAVATGVGALPALAVRKVSRTTQYAMLGFGAGVMLAATAFSLVVPGLTAGEALVGNRWTAGILVAFGLIAGGVAIGVLDRLIPSAPLATRGADARRVWLFVLAIALHNLPEGLAVGVAFGQPDTAKAIAVALGIGIQNLPEGLVVALALASLGYSRTTAATIALATGVVEPVGGLLGALVPSVSEAILPAGLAFAAGAMLWVTSHEIIPESHRGGPSRAATGALLTGFVLMMLLDNLLT